MFPESVCSFLTSTFLRALLAARWCLAAAWRGTEAARVICLRKPAHIHHVNKGFPSNATRRNAPSTNEIIDGANAEAQCASSVSPRIEQLFDFPSHPSAPLRVYLVRPIRRPLVIRRRSPQASSELAPLSKTLHQLHNWFCLSRTRGCEVKWTPGGARLTPAWIQWTLILSLDFHKG